MTALFVREDGGRVVVKPAVIYPHYLQQIGHTGEVTQGALETARAVFTEDLMRALGKPLHLYISRDDNFRLTQFPVGEPPRQAVGAWYENLPGSPITRLGISVA